MEHILPAITKKLRPDLETLNGLERAMAIAEAVGLLYAAPLALVGLLWLVAATDATVIRQQWPTLLLLLLLACVFQRLRFFLFMEVKETPASATGSLGTIVTWTGALLFGPSALWLAVFSSQPGLTLIRRWRQLAATGQLLGTLRSFCLDVTDTTLSSLIALALYERWGGAFPLPRLSAEAVLPAFCATLVQFSLSLLIWMPYLIYALTRITTWTDSSTSKEIFVKMTVVGLAVPGLLNVFAILAAGLRTQAGLGALLFFVAGLLLASWSARQLSRAVERSQQRSRELARLEQLGRAILHAPPDASTLPQLLCEHVPGMFPSSQIEIRRFPDRTLLRHPGDCPPAAGAIWEWLRTVSRARFFLPQAVLPWSNQPAQKSVVIAPILHTGTSEPIGGVYVAPAGEPGAVKSLLPAVQSLAAQVSSTLQGAEAYAQALAHQKMEQELALAGEIQASFLPTALPTISGWQLAVTLAPARQTSGDFYDVIPLPNGRLGLLVADVAEKGMGAALYMALSRTLIRTYAAEHHTRPDFAFRVANNRILTDTEVDLFVTVFYGILDPLSGRLTYCNAGHNPPYLLSAQNNRQVTKLGRTGMPLGVFRGETWEQRTVQLAPGDVLLLYTDGVTEAQDRQERFFGQERLLAAAQAHLGRSAQELQQALLAKVYDFVGDAPQFDDITLMVLVRETRHGP
jgi:serine phosphatase RsbU (regulator of sigma subunit)